MSKDINEIMLNSVRMRIVQTLATNENMTANEISQKISSVPCTTLYRHINILLDANILTVIEQKKIRGSYERTLALNLNEMVLHNSTESMSKQVLGFFMNIYAKFENYFNSKNYLTANGKFFYNNTVMMMDDQEFEQFLSELQALIIKYHYNVAKGRKARDISIISSPLESENENE